MLKALLDGWSWYPHKRRLLIVGAAAIALGCIGIVAAAGPAVEALVQGVIGTVATIFPPTIAAISLGIVGKAFLSKRIGRNESFNHAGNVVFA